MRKRKHTRGYVTRIIAVESNLTKDDVIRLYHEHWGTHATYDHIIDELTHCSVDSIRWFLRVGKYKEKENDK